MLQYPQWIMYESFLTDEECDELLEIGLSFPPQMGSTFRTGEDESHDEENHGHRKTQIRWVPFDETITRDIFTKLSELAVETNKQYFHVDFDFMPPLQFTEYLEPGHHYDFHHDIDWNRQDGRNRKLSMVIQLTDPKDYGGGDLIFRHHASPDETAVKQRGTIIFFLPYREHAVTPITEGTRRSFVGWFEGPNWR